MSSNSFAPEIGFSSQSPSLDECMRDEFASSASDDPRRLHTGKRGRPPIDLTHEGLVDRRRNQVRKAQRNYRIRKAEEAIIRRNYVADLESQIDRMRQSFLELSSHIRKATVLPGVPDLERQLQNITHNFLPASQDSDAPSRSPPDDSDRNRDRSRDGPISPRLDDYTSCATTSLVPATESIQMSTPIRASAVGFPLSLFGIQAPLPRNFAQRLYSSCIKRAYHLLTSPYAERTEVARVFQYSFQFSDANTMILTFDTLLRTNGDYQTARVYRLGGAGTHYTKTPPEWSIVKYTPLSEQTPFENDDDIWFDSRDIEGWLEENGLAIGGTQSFMYLSELPSFRLCQHMTLCNGHEPGESPELSDQRVAMVLDVDKFLEGLLSRGVCLGNAPGFRRCDVEAAFNLAITDETAFVRE
ncbi:hypothetical protein EYZ11_009365 [Aspergillus tanneri]|nr:hypothetical protein EYZ11_009365 [Aspergillus tanneri]